MRLKVGDNPPSLACKIHIRVLQLDDSIFTSYGFVMTDIDNKSKDIGGADCATQRAAEDIAHCGKSLYHSGFIAGTEGNISLRLSDGRFLITPAGARKGELVGKSIVELEESGAQISKQDDLKPSSELGMHLMVYQKRKDIFACVHSHAPHATAYAIAGIQPDIDILPEVSVFVGKIALTEYAPPGTPAVGESLLPALETCNAFLLKNHGLLTIGATLDEALNRHEIVEQYLRILTIAKSLGNIDKLDASEMKRLRGLSE